MRSLVRANRSLRRGVTLLEVLVAIVIVQIGIQGFLVRTLHGVAIRLQ